MKSYIGTLVLALLRYATTCVLRRAHIPVVGVTGSVGKSSAVTLLGEVLGSAYRVKVTRKGNSETGLPLEILGLRETLSDYSLISWIRVLWQVMGIIALGKNPLSGYTLLIAEMGIDSPYEPKNMSYLLSFLQPDIGIVLNAGPCHTEQFAQELSYEDQANVDMIVQSIAKEKMKLVMHLPPGGTAIIHNDNPYIQAYKHEIQQTIVTFGSGETATFRLTDHHADTKGTTYQFLHGKKSYTIHIPNMVLFREYGEIYLAVIACAYTLEVPISDAILLLEQKTTLPPGRSSFFETKSGISILDSSYNASPLALEHALAFVGTFPWKGKKVAVIGDMRELGPLSLAMHTDMALWLQHANLDMIVLVGKETSAYTLPALQKAGYANPVYAFHTAEGVGRFLLDHGVGKGDLVFLKGSQNTIYLETVAQDLLENTKQSRSLLCRQTPYWDGVRTAFFAKEKQVQYL